MILSISPFMQMKLLVFILLILSCLAKPPVYHSYGDKARGIKDWKYEKTDYCDGLAGSTDC
jgi:hypothetical protein